MSDKVITSFEKIGYKKIIPEDDDINNYESISIKDKLGKTTTLYRNLNNKKRETDNTTNFNSSWDIYNKLLGIILFSCLQNII